MKFGRDKTKSKICPRCNIKVPQEIDTCPDCGLIFSRLAVATNKEAKAKKKRGDREFIINSPKLPSDVSFVKLLLLCIFLGPVGAHAYYVGRYLRGSVLSVNFVCLTLTVIFSEKLSTIHDGKFIALLSTIFGFVLLAWFYDIIMIVLKKFKVPVAIDVEGEIQKKKEEYFESLKEIEEVTRETEKEEKIVKIDEKRTKNTKKTQKNSKKR